MAGLRTLALERGAVVEGTRGAVVESCAGLTVGGARLAGLRLGVSKEPSETVLHTHLLLFLALSDANGGHEVAGIASGACYLIATVGAPHGTRHTDCLLIVKVLAGITGAEFADVTHTLAILESKVWEAIRAAVTVLPAALCTAAVA